MIGNFSDIQILNYGGVAGIRLSLSGGYCCISRGASVPLGVQGKGNLSEVKK